MPHDDSIWLFCRSRCLSPSRLPVRIIRSIWKVGQSEARPSNKQARRGGMCWPACHRSANVDLEHGHRSTGYLGKLCFGLPTRCRAGNVNVGRTPHPDTREANIDVDERHVKRRSTPSNTSASSRVGSWEDKGRVARYSELWPLVKFNLGSIVAEVCTTSFWRQMSVYHVQSRPNDSHY